VNKINNNTVKNSPSIESFFQSFNDYATCNNSKTPILVFHNSKFDKNFFEHWSSFYLGKKSKKYFFVDSIKIIKHSTSESIKLQDLYDNFLKTDDDGVNLHNANDDVKILLKILLKIFSNEKNMENYLISMFENKQPNIQLNKLEKIFTNQLDKKKNENEKNNGNKENLIIKIKKNKINSSALKKIDNSILYENIINLEHKNDDVEFISTGKEKMIENSEFNEYMENNKKIEFIIEKKKMKININKEEWVNSFKLQKLLEIYEKKNYLKSIYCPNIEFFKNKLLILFKKKFKEEKILFFIIWYKNHFFEIIWFFKENLNYFIQLDPLNYSKNIIDFIKNLNYVDIHPQNSSFECGYYSILFFKKIINIEEKKLIPINENKIKNLMNLFNETNKSELEDIVKEYKTIL
jgi:hypothetical protein